MKPRPKVVFDTNVFISAIIFGGNPRQCLELARSGKVGLFSSRAILLELAKILQGKFLWDEEEVKEVIEGVRFAHLVYPKQRINVIKRDPPDNRILECAKEAGADFIISGDKKHLLSLEKFENIPIISSKQLLDIFYKLRTGRLS